MADRVARAKALLAVAAGARFTDAARAAGRHSGDGVAKLVARFNADGLAALTDRPRGRPPLRYGPAEAQRIVREARRAPDRERDGTHLVAGDLAAGAAASTRRLARGEHLHPPARPP